jgi:hypothetical protein
MNLAWTEDCRISSEFGGVPLLDGRRQADGKQ